MQGLALKRNAPVRAMLKQLHMHGGLFPGREQHRPLFSLNAIFNNRCIHVSFTARKNVCVFFFLLINFLKTDTQTHTHHSFVRLF